MALLNLGASAHRTMACRFALSPVIVAFGLVYYLGTYVVEAQPNVSRVVVQKRIAATQVSDSMFAAVSSIHPALFSGDGQGYSH